MREGSSPDSPSATMSPTGRRGDGLIRILEHDLHPRAQPANGLVAQAGDVHTVHVDPPGRPLQPQRRQSQGGLAGAGFADEADGLAFTHRDADPVHCTHMADGAAQQAPTDREMHFHVFRPQERFRIR